MENIVTMPGYSYHKARCQEALGPLDGSDGGGRSWNRKESYISVTERVYMDV